MTAQDTMFPLALRDTALTVASLAGGAAPESFTAFRDRCAEQVNRLGEELRAAGQPPDVIEDATYAQCALLDEFALKRLVGTARDEWEREPLQVGKFQSHDAGDELIARIQRRLAQPQPVLPLLTVFHVVLGLGFRGRFAIDGDKDRDALVHALEDRLARHGMVAPSASVVVLSGKTGARWNVSPLAWVVCAALGAGLVYLALDRWLDRWIAGLAG